MALARTLKLNTGAVFPMAGINVKNNDRAENLDHCLSIGFKHVCTSWSRKGTKVVGDVLKTLENQGLVNRKDLFITVEMPKPFMSEQGTQLLIEESLEQLQTTYIDMLQLRSRFYPEKVPEVHEDIQVPNIGFLDGWKFLESTVKDGHVKALGVRDMSITQMEQLNQASEIKISNLFSECHCYLQEDALRKYCRENNIVFTATQPLGFVKYRPTAKFDVPPLHKHEAVQRIAKLVNVHPEQVLLRYLADLDISYITLCRKPQVMKKHSEILDFKLRVEDKFTLRSMNCQLRYITDDNSLDHKDHALNSCDATNSIVSQK